jgi:hypothetical protein
MHCTDTDGGREQREEREGKTKRAAFQAGVGSKLSLSRFLLLQTLGELSKAWKVMRGNINMLTDNTEM